MPDYRTPIALSPSALAKWEGAPDEAFTSYIVPKAVRPPRAPQTDPMSVGSAFDALVKNNLYKLFFGEQRCLADVYRLRDLLYQQCEEHTLPESLVIAVDVFDQYIECGALDDLIDLIRASDCAPRMEFDVVRNVGGVPLLGKPDLHFHTFVGLHVIADWKVSGACSRCGVSPQQGYMIARTVADPTGVAHKRFVPVQHPGKLVVSGLPMNETTNYWADQLSTYAWALGEPIGSQNFICRIEQMACRPCPKGDPSKRLRVKSCVHQSTVAEDYQHELLERYKRVWRHITEGHYFADLSKSESNARANMILRRLQAPPADVTKMSIGTLPTLSW